MDSSERWTPDAAGTGNPPADGGEPFFLEVGEGEESAETFRVTEPAPTGGQAAGEDVPGWFARKQSKQAAKDKAARRSRPSKKKTKKRQIIVETQEDEEEHLTWQEQLHRWAVGGEGKSFGVSLAFHFVLLLVLSVMLISGMREEDISTLVTVANEEMNDFEEIADTTVEMDDEVVQPELQMIKEAVVQPGVVLGASISDFLAGENAGGTSPFKFSMPKSGAVSKGSFTAWTNPKDPAPGEKYLIIIQIKLPPKLKRYPLKDLEGKVVGTDGYEREIPDDEIEKKYPTGYLPVKGNQTQLVVGIPGGARLVKDRIHIKSLKILKEQQILEIEF